MTATTLVTYDDTKNYELLADCNENQEYYIILYAWKGLSSYIAGLVGEMFVLTNQTVLSSPFARSPSPSISSYSSYSVQSWEDQDRTPSWLDSTFSPKAERTMASI